MIPGQRCPGARHLSLEKCSDHNVVWVARRPHPTIACQAGEVQCNQVIGKIPKMHFALHSGRDSTMVTVSGGLGRGQAISAAVCGRTRPACCKREVRCQRTRRKASQA